LFTGYFFTDLTLLKINLPITSDELAKTKATIDDFIDYQIYIEILGKN
jgi:hypothetical protein